MVEHKVIGICNYLAEFQTLPLGGGIPEVYRHVIMGDFRILLGHDVDDGIPQTESGQQQGSASADADEHHGQTLAVAENIAQGYLVQETEFLPDF